MGEISSALPEDFQIKKFFEKNHFELSDRSIALLKEFCGRLLDWNKKINLISRRDEENVWTRHIVGSVSFLFHIQPISGSSVLDLGTGGGLPGIPLAILRPDLKLTLIDSTQKKVRAVQEMIDGLGLKNISAIWTRAEDLSAKNPFKHSFDYIIARGVASIIDIVKWSKPLLKAGDPIGDSLAGKTRPLQIPRGAVLLLKGGDIDDEIKRARVAHHPRQIQTLTIITDGVDPSELVEKKIVLVYP